MQIGLLIWAIILLILFGSFEIIGILIIALVTMLFTLGYEETKKKFLVTLIGSIVMILYLLIIVAIEK